MMVPPGNGGDTRLTVPVPARAVTPFVRVPTPPRLRVARLPPTPLERAAALPRNYYASQQRTSRRIRRSFCSSIAYYPRDPSRRSAPSFCFLLFPSVSYSTLCRNAFGCVRYINRKSARVCVSFIYYYYRKTRSRKRVVILPEGILSLRTIRYIVENFPSRVFCKRAKDRRYS